MWHIHYTDAHGREVKWRSLDKREQAFDQCCSFRRDLGASSVVKVVDDNGVEIPLAEIEAYCVARAAKG
jgi:hypothetical protein